MACLHPGHGWYRGDVVTFPNEPGGRTRGIIRELSRDRSRARVQIGADWTWLFTGDLTWTGECLTARAPRTGWGWKRLGRKIASAGA